MTLDEITYNLAELLNREGDLEFIGQLERQVDYYRALLFRRSADKNSTISSQFVQVIPCLKMEVVPAIECVELETDCVVVRSTQRVPSFIRLNTGSAVSFIGTVDKKIRYNEVDFNAAKYSKYNKYVKKSPGFYIVDGYIHLINANPEVIRIEGIFEEPKKLSEVAGCDNKFVLLEENYPCSLDMVQQITQSILSIEGRLPKPENDEGNEQTKNTSSQGYVQEFPQGQSRYRRNIPPVQGDD